MNHYFLNLFLALLLITQTTSINIAINADGSTTEISSMDISVLRKAEKVALIHLYKTTAGDSWRDNNKWTRTDIDPCNWYGLTCGSHKLIEEISLVANKLNGTIPDIWSDFSQLKRLDLSLNYLKGPVPKSMNQLELIEEIDLGYNYLLVSLRTFSTMKQLQSLTLRWNTLITGSLLDLVLCTNLNSINFRDNTMESLTLKGIEQLPALLHVDLTKSGLRGDLHLHHLNGLITFIAANNYLSGSFDDSTGDGDGDGTRSKPNLTLLEHFDISNNMLTGPIPSLGSAEALFHLDVSNNEFITSNLIISNHLNLKILKLNGNRIEASFPYDLYKLTQLETFECNNCELHGVIGLPLNSLPNLETLSIYNNHLVGTVPRTIFQMQHLIKLDISNNQLNGILPKSIGTMTQLETLRMAFNQFTGEIPIELNQCIELKEVRLEHNFFSGHLPNIFGIAKSSSSTSTSSSTTSSLSSVTESQMDRLDMFSIHNNQLTSIPLHLPSNIQVWPLGLRPEASVSSSRTISLVVYHNNFPLENRQDVVQDVVQDVQMFRVCGTMNDFYANTLLRAGWLRTETDRYHASYGLCYQEIKPHDPKNILSIQRVSRFPDVGQVSDKGHLTQNIEIMRKEYPKEYSFYPTSFTIPNQLTEYITEFNTVGLQLKKDVENLWLMKPRARCCGEGIRIISNATQSKDLVDPDLGEWYVQKFVSPPALIDGHKFVFRLFAVVTSFSPLRVQLYHDGLIFYTFTPYDVSNQTAKRSYISDYFFTEKQSDYYVLVQDYLGNMSNGTHYKTKSETIDPSDSSDSSDPHVSKSQQGGPMHAKQVWKDIKSVVVKSLIATLRWTTKMEADQVIPGTTYEIFGYDIVLDNELNPYLCEINETPNMGLEVNYHSDYHGLGAAIEQQDYTYKTELMDATLAVADVEPRYSMNDLNEIKLEILDIIRVNNLACLMEDRVVTKGSTESSTEGQKSVTDVNEGDGSECLNDSDLEIIVKLESELKRSDNNEYEQVFPCVECSKYFKLMKVKGLEWNDVLNVWWVRQRETRRYQLGLTHRYENVEVQIPTLEPWVGFLLQFVDE